MMIFKKAIQRRTFLRGLGATIALPLLDGMVPAFASTADAAAAAGAMRLAYLYVPCGIMMDKWTPPAEGALTELPPVLAEIAPYKDRLLVLSGLDGGPALVGGHQRAASMWLTGAEPKKSDYDVYLGISADQVAAKELGKQTQLPSIELCIENAAEKVGSPTAGYSAAYTNTISWRTPTTPLPMEHKPRAVFERLFGDGDSTSPAARLSRIQKDRSILDFVSADVNRLLTRFGASDHSKLSEYLDAIRDVETRVQKAEAQSSKELPEMTRPVGVPAVYHDHAKLMYDLMVLAFQTDMTRVASFMMAMEQSNRVYNELNQTEAHHPLSHNRGEVRKMEETARINVYHAQQLRYFLDRLQATPDGNGSMLDHTMVLYGSGLGDGDLHTQHGVPALLIAGGVKGIKGGQHLRYAKGTPFCNLHVAMLNTAGIPVDSFGDSTAKLDLA